jgi:protein phosphatase
MNITIPELSLVVLVGPSGSGKSTFSLKHFKKTEVLSSDYCRGLISDDENDQTVSQEAFDVLQYIVKKRLALKRLTVVDATSVKPEDRRKMVALAREFHVLPVAIVFNLPAKLCQDRNQSRLDRNFGPHVIRQQSQALRRSLRGMKREGFRQVSILATPEEIDSVTIERSPLWTNRQNEHGPFDIIGDIHGCFDELCELLQTMDYHIEINSDQSIRVWHPNGRKAIFLGDLVDRGPKTPDVLRLVMSMVAEENALCIPGNHDVKLHRKLQGRDVKLTYGLAESIQQLEHESNEFKESVSQFIDSLVSHYILDDGKLVVAHAGLKEDLQGRASGRVREFALYGETTGETDEYGLPIRYHWAADYRGKAMVVYGHTPSIQIEWINRTICIDTGCVFGGKLTALRYPEKEIVQVQAHKTYYESVRPLHIPDSEKPPEAERPYNDLLDISDVSGKRVINNRIHHTVTIREENAVAALEIMSRFAIDPHWLIYLPPTMAPSDTCKEGDNLEYPSETFSYYRYEGVPKVICQEKHMGSRAVMVFCKDEESAFKRFGVKDNTTGVIYTRTGRPFFHDLSIQDTIIEKLRQAANQTGLWEKLNTNWLCLDVEIMPWSTKAQVLLQSQYAPTGTSARFALEAANKALKQASEREGGDNTILARFDEKAKCISKYIDAYRQYCWKVDSIEDLKIAPFHLLASEGGVHIDKDHLWHMNTLGDLCDGDSQILCKTPYKIIDITNPENEQQGIHWWEELTSSGKEGMVVKPLDWIVRGRKGLVQPALKCRGREYLRIIYGPEYTIPEHLNQLRRRGLSVKRSLALREFALGLEALHRFVESEPLYRVHECVFGVLALESEPVDPRL